MRAILDGLRQLVQALRTPTRPGADGSPLTAAQLFVLQQLAEHPGASLNELAARTHTHQSSVSVVVKRLSDEGLVTRRTSSVDGRRLELSLTAAGAARLRRAPEAPQARLVRALEQLDSPAQQALAQGLKALSASMGLSTEPPAMFFEDDSHTPPHEARSPAPRKPHP